MKKKNRLKDFIKERKFLLIGLAVLIPLLAFAGGRILTGKKAVSETAALQTKTVEIGKNFEFPALNNQGKTAPVKMKLQISNAEKTNQVSVKDQLFTAKNNKMFLIVSVELKNDATYPLNIITGDLVRLAIEGDSENKYAPDLHNNAVNVSAISTKIDRLGFVIPGDAEKFSLYVGELEGKKETVNFGF